MSSWLTFWQLVLIFGIGAFVLSLVVIIPLGARDIWFLLNRLGSNRGADRPKPEDPR